MQWAQISAIQFIMAKCDIENYVNNKKRTGALFCARLKYPFDLCVCVSVCACNGSRDLWRMSRAQSGEQTIPHTHSAWTKKIISCYSVIVAIFLKVSSQRAMHK